MAERVVAAFARDAAGWLPGAVEHVGATSLPAGWTKGDVDVNVRVTRDEFGPAVAALRRQLTIAQPENWTPTFASFSADGYELPLGVQVTVIGSDDDFLVKLRDRLIGDPALAARYDRVKSAAASSGADAYWQAKDEFLTKLLREPTS